MGTKETGIKGPLKCLGTHSFVWCVDAISMKQEAKAGHIE